MSKLLHDRKTGLTYKKCLEFLELTLNDKFKDNLEIRIDKVFSEIDLTMRANVMISYFKKGDSDG